MQTSDFFINLQCIQLYDPQTVKRNFSIVASLLLYLSLAHFFHALFLYSTCGNDLTNKCSKIGHCFLVFLLSSRYESYHEVEMGNPIASKFGAQKGGVRVHLGTKFG